MEFLETMQSSYNAVIKEKWKNLQSELMSDKTKIVFPMTTTKDTAVHLAVYSGEEEPTRGLLAAITELMYEEFWKNDSGNTPLHEAAAVGNLPAAKLLVEFNKNDLLNLNIYGETPLYRAARCGHLSIVQYFLDDCEDFFARAPLNWIRENGTPIIHAAIQSGKFDVVLKLIDFDKSLMEMIDVEKRTALYLLANMPHTFKSGSSMSFFHSIIYYLLPDEEDFDIYNISNFRSLENNKSDISNEDLEAGSKPNHPHKSRNQNRWLCFLNCLIWKFFMEGWSQVREVYEKKRHHKLVVIVTEMLARVDRSWERTRLVLETDDIDTTGIRHRVSIDEGEHLEINYYGGGDDKNEIEYDDCHETPLLLAVTNGIIEIVEKIFEAHPHAMDYITKKQRNILHIAIAYRQKFIFDWMQRKRFIMRRLLTTIDNFGFTALHHVGCIRFCGQGDQPVAGPALQLQQELIWFQRVKKEMPALYSMHHNTRKETAYDLFKKTHQDLYKDAVEWVKKTSESCSGIAILIATVVFAAAYTVPGGIDERTGLPNFISHPIFMAFTVTDIIALAASLTSVILFLSILTSAFPFDDFVDKIPHRLTIGLTCLLVAVVTTMLAFSLTIVLTLQSQKNWTIAFVYLAAFLPVIMFVSIQLPLYLAPLPNLKSIPNKILKLLPLGFIHRCFKLTSVSSYSSWHRERYYM